MSRRQSTITPEQFARWRAWLNQPIDPPSGTQLDWVDPSRQQAELEARKGFRDGMDSSREVPRRRVRSSRG